jgi:hypothetical protein
LSAPHWVLLTTFKIASALAHLVLSFFGCGTKDNLLSKITPQNLSSYTICFRFPSNLRSRSLSSCLHFWQKWTSFVSDFKDLKLLLSAKPWILFKQSWSCRSIFAILLERYEVPKLSTNKQSSISVLVPVLNYSS